ncbi:hypothetical protein F7725_023790 [Dissostichus mawsoni]|uniref:Uncharacterized protein n=1 Tax=Dissostichus mawsoni TaxID=36200 RepID=A0A7J5XZ30_DISMA|nr:hypothetical protein F7725_023790 [Dissostichus mawsoni]
MAEMLLRYWKEQLNLTHLHPHSQTTHPPAELRADLHAFHRRIKLKDHFLGSQGREPVPFTGPSTWEPYTDTLTPEITQLINKNLDTLRHWRPLPQRGEGGLRHAEGVSADLRLPQNKNLKDLLVHTKLKDNSVRAREAPQISEVGFICLPHIFNPFSKLGANLGRALQPTTKNAVYAVRCRACHKLYVGETRHEISLRITLNLQSLGLESSGSWTTAQRRAAERRWIHRLKTIDPRPQ